MDKIGANVAIDKTWLNKLIKLDAINRPITATIIGIKAAVKLPKVKNKINNDAITAIISLV